MGWGEAHQPWGPPRAASSFGKILVESASMNAMTAVATGSRMPLGVVKRPIVPDEQAGRLILSKPTCAGSEPAGRVVRAIGAVARADGVVG